MNEEGFTLLEILIAITITGIILVAVFMFVDQGLFTWENRTDSSQWEQNCRVLDKYLNDDLHNLFYSNLFKENSFQGTNQKLSYLVKKNDILKEVSYRVDYYSNTLIREEKPYSLSSYLNFNINQDENNTVTGGEKRLSFFSDTEIFRIDFEYYDPETGGWSSLWSLEEKEYLPSFLRITVTKSDYEPVSLISNIYIDKEYERGAFIYE